MADRDTPTAARLDALIDRAGLQQELGITAAAVEQLMRKVDKVTVPGLRKVFVRRRDIQRLLDEGTKAA